MVGKRTNTGAFPTWLRHCRSRKDLTMYAIVRSGFVLILLAVCLIAPQTMAGDETNTPAAKPKIGPTHMGDASKSPFFPSKNVK